MVRSQQVPEEDHVCSFVLIVVALRLISFSLLLFDNDAVWKCIAQKKRHTITRQWCLKQELQELLAGLIEWNISWKKRCTNTFLGLHKSELFTKKNSEKQIKWTFRNSAILLSEMFNSSDSKVNLIKCEHFKTWETTSLPKENLILLQKGDLMLRKVAKNNRVFPLRTINLHDPQGWFGYYKLQQFWSLSFICAHI